MISKFLFWNLGKKDLHALLELAVRENDVDFVILAECPCQPSEVLLALNSSHGGRFQFNSGRCETIKIFSTFPLNSVRPIHEGARFTIRRIQLPLREEILLVAVHLPSKLRWRDSSQEHEVISLADDIREAEKKIKHSRTVLVGDFNMQPFEDGMTGAKGLHGTMSRHVASRGSRTVQAREYPYFYNPMWSLMGDLSHGPPGSYYYESGQHIEHYWWMFDQVLLRPELSARAGDRSFRLVTEIAGKSLLNAKAQPDLTNGSDHLPLYFELDF